MGILLLQDFAVILLVAGVVGWIFRKIGLSAVVGFLLAGIIIGPYTPPFTLVTDIERIQALSELGLVFLMFFVGMGLNLKRIRSMGFTILAATAITALVVFCQAQGFAAVMGWDGRTGLVFAAMLMVSSSAIITRLLAEKGLTHERFGQTAQGITVLEDVVAVIMLTVIGSQIQATGDEGKSVGATVFLLMGFTVTVIVLGLILLPRLLNRVSHSSDADLKALLVSGLVIGAGFLSVHAGFSVALGAFLFGVVVAESSLRGRIEKRLSGMQDIFSAVFFVSIGMLIDVAAFVDHAVLILGVSLFAIVARTLAAWAGLTLAGRPIATAASAAVILTPVGEFSYIIAQLGVISGMVPESFFAIAVGTSVITATIAPLLARSAERMGGVVERAMPQPVSRCLEHYASFLDSAASRADRIHVWRLTRGHAGLVLIELLLLVGLFGFSPLIRDAITRFLVRAGYEWPGWELAFWAFILTLGLVITAAIWRILYSLTLIYAEVLANQREGARRLRRILHTIFQVLIALILGGLVLWTFPLRELPLLQAGGIVISGVLVLVLLWRPIIRLHTRFEISLLHSVRQNRFPGVVLARVVSARHHRDWGFDIMDVVLPDMAECAGQTIGELALRSRFGCSVLAIDRQGFSIPNPSSDETFYSGDRVLLFGTDDQVAECRQVLMTERQDFASTKFDEAVLESVAVPDGSRVHGRTLGELAVFQQTGVQIVGIEHEGNLIRIPSGTEKLHDGDLLLIMADRTGLRHFQRWLEGQEDRNSG